MPRSRKRCSEAVAVEISIANSLFDKPMAAVQILLQNAMASTQKIQPLLHYAVCLRRFCICFWGVAINLLGVWSERCAFVPRKINRENYSAKFCTIEEFPTIFRRLTIGNSLIVDNTCIPSWFDVHVFPLIEDRKLEVAKWHYFCIIVVFLL